MKALDPALQAHLDSGATTLAWCWRLTRRDGARQGFTDHDRDIVFDGTTFEAAAGFTASEMRDAVGLSVDNLEVTSALSSEHLAEADLAAGFYDEAKVEIWRVNWSTPGERVLMRSGSLGEVKRAGIAFAAEVRGLAHYLGQPSGRLFQYTCDADLGDARCTVNAALPAFGGTGTVLAVMGMHVGLPPTPNPSPQGGGGPRYTRADIVRLARNWIGTPYHHQASEIGLGADCLGVVRGVWRALHGYEAEALPAYSRDWAEAGRRETMLEGARRHMVEIAVSEAQPGDVLVFRLRPATIAKHAAIQVTASTMVHAMEGGPACEVPLGPWWRRRVAGAFVFANVTNKLHARNTPCPGGGISPIEQ